MYTDTFAFTEKEELHTESACPSNTQEHFIDDEDLLSVSLRLIEKNREAYEVLAK